MICYRHLLIMISITLILYADTAHALGAREASISTNGKQKTNIYGTLKTVHGKDPIEVDNITINGMVRDIKVYEMPEDAAGNKADSLDSAELATIKFDLKQISCLVVSPSRRRWTLKRKGYTRRRDYLEVKITNKNNKETSYLMDAETKIAGDRIVDASLVPEEVSLSGLEVLDIQGSCERTETGKCAVEPKINKRRRCGAGKSAEAQPATQPSAAQ